MSASQKNLPLILIGVVLAVCGFALDIYSLPGIGAMTKGSTQVVVPGDAELALEDIGNYTVFHETVAVVDGIRYESSASLRNDMVIDLIHQESGDAVDMETTPPLSNYSRGADRRGESAFRFEIEEPGTYDLHVDYISGAESPRAVLNITYWSSFDGKMALQVGGGFALIGIGVVLIFIGNGAFAGSRGKQSSAFIYEHRVDYRGSADAAFDVAEKALLPLNFELDYVGSDTLDAVGPGMQSTKQPALQGATRLHFTCGGNEIRLRAELGGVRFMRNFLMTFIPGMGLIFLLLFGGASLGGALPSWTTIMVVAPLVPWIFIGPVMIKWIRTRTTNAIDTLMANMAKNKSTSG